MGFFFGPQVQPSPNSIYALVLVKKSAQNKPKLGLHFSCKQALQNPGGRHDCMLVRHLSCDLEETMEHRMSLIIPLKVGAPSGVDFPSGPWILP